MNADLAKFSERFKARLEKSKRIIMILESKGYVLVQESAAEKQYLSGKKNMRVDVILVTGRCYVQNLDPIFRFKKYSNKEVHQMMMDCLTGKFFTKQTEFTYEECIDEFIRRGGYDAVVEEASNE